MAAAVPIADRYELRALLLDDGVKQVHAGFDRQLDRDVRVEVATTEDAEQRARFLARARLLAAENHPHLSTVYDTGEESDRPYAILEPAGEPTLAQRLRDGPPFALTQVVEVGIGLCQAASAALQRELAVEPLDPADVLLRDADYVKLGNLLLRPEASSEAATPPVTSEQALVARIAGLLVAAALPPGTVDTTRPITRASDLPAGLPVTLRTIVLAAIATRGASIRTLSELRQALTDYRGAAQLTTRAFSPVRRSGTAAAGAGAAASGVPSGVPPGPLSLPVTRSLPAAGGRRQVPDVAPRRAVRRAGSLFSLISLLVILALIVGVGAFALWLGGVDRGVPPTQATTDNGNASQPTAAPQPRGQSLLDHLRQATATPTPNPQATATPPPTEGPQGQLGGIPDTPTVGGARATETALAMATTTAGYIATLTATAGPTSTPTVTPTVTVSPSPSPSPSAEPTPTPPASTPTPVPGAAVPDVTGHSLSDAVQILSQAGFAVARTADRSDSSAPAGTVVAEDPSPASIIPLGSVVRLTVSSGAPTMAVPNVVGLPSAVAQSTLSARGFGSKLIGQPSTNVPPGNVIAESPGAGAALPPGSVVTLTVSQGDVVVVPKLVGLPEGEAQAAIKAAGLTPTFANHSGHDPSVPVGAVESQQPVAGTVVPRGTTVYINVRSS